MAHPKRKEWAEQLSKELACPIYWDIDNNVWNTCKGAWNLHEKDADFHVVIQDDAILTSNFKEKTKNFIENICKYNKNVAFQLYHGGGKNDQKQVIQFGYKQGYVIKHLMAWGVAICLPVSLISEMLRFGDGYYMWQDDIKIKYFLKNKKIPTIFPLPSLVDHRKMTDGNNTLTGSADSDRYSPYFEK